ncbi:MAG: hypothetical protein ACKPH1_28895 [Microcystis panniformis]
MDVKPSDGFGLKIHLISFGRQLTVVTEGEGVLDIEFFRFFPCSLAGKKRKYLPISRR